MRPREVYVVETGVSNVASVYAALYRAGWQPKTATELESIESAERLVIPGVGAFGAAMQRLREHGFVEPLKERLADGRPTLAICLGLQLLAEQSQECPGQEGLGVFEGEAERFPADLAVPHLGWNHVTPEGSDWLEAGAAYFAHSYRLSHAPAGWQVAWATYAGRFVAALARDGVLACQFHPELSGAWGRRLSERWLEEGTVC